MSDKICYWIFHLKGEIQMNKALPNDPDAYNNRGVAYSNKGDYDQARRDYNRAEELSRRL